MHRWFEQLITLKRQKVLNEPELFATYSAIAQEARGVVQAHASESSDRNIDTDFAQVWRLIVAGLVVGE